MNRAIAWMAGHPVASNLLMIFIIVSGVLAMFRVNSEIFPEFSLDMITVEVPYLGAAPQEVEEAADKHAREIGVEWTARQVEGLLRQVEQDYDWVLLDCPPRADGLLTANAIRAADTVLLVVETGSGTITTGGTEVGRTIRWSRMNDSALRPNRRYPVLQS